jgi:hypothetical protein
MTKKIVEVPQFVTDWFTEELKTKDLLQVDVEVFDYSEKFLFRHGLTFARDLKFHGTNGYSLHINDYIKRLLHFSKRPIKIYVNRTLLSDIQQKYLPPPEVPTAIDLSNTKDATNGNS